MHGQSNAELHPEGRQMNFHDLKVNEHFVGLINIDILLLNPDYHKDQDKLDEYQEEGEVPVCQKSLHCPAIHEER